MELKIRLISIICSLLLSILVIDLVKRKKLKEEYSILWISASIILIILSLWKSLIDKFASLIGIAYPPSALFVVLIFLGILFLLHVSLVLSKLSEQNKTLIQKIGMLEYKIKELQKEVQGSKNEEL
jgi:hypothetical protein